MDMKPISQKEDTYNFQDSTEFRKNFSWDDINKNFTWNETGKINIAYEAIDRHANHPTKRNQPAFIYTSSDEEVTYSFLDLSRESNRFANVLRKHEVKKGDRVFLMMPRIPAFFSAFFGILKTGAIAGPLHEDMMQQAIFNRLDDSEASVLVTTDDYLNRIPYQDLPSLEKIIVIGSCPTEDRQFVDYENEMRAASDEFDIEWVNLNDGMLLHYTTSSTDKAKGVYHAHQAMIQQYATGEWVLDLREDDRYWSTTNPAWVSGTSYGIFAPFLHGVTIIVNGGEKTPHVCYSILERYGVSVWYTNPAVLRMLVSEGESVADRYNRRNLRHIVSGGEQLHPEMLTWGLHVFNLRIHDTWMMAETGTQLIANFPCHEIRPGSMGKTIPGIKAAILDYEGNLLGPNQMGNLAIKGGWPSMMQAIHQNSADFESYFLDDWFITGDRAYQDEDGYFWFQGRLSDVIHTFGERLSPFEIESMLIEYPAIREVGVIGKPDPEKGEIIKAYITLHDGFKESKSLLEEIRTFIKQSLSVNAVPDEIEVRNEIPKTESGKIMRQLLKSWDEEQSIENEAQ
jgi:acetyl-CoA synthetase